MAFLLLNERLEGLMDTRINERGGMTKSAKLNTLYKATKLNHYSLSSESVTSPSNTKCV